MTHERDNHLPTTYEALKNGDTITIEPWRAKAFPVIKDLVVDRSSLIELFNQEVMFCKYRSAPDGNNTNTKKHC